MQPERLKDILIGSDNYRSIEKKVTYIIRGRLGQDPEPHSASSLKSSKFNPMHIIDQAGGSVFYNDMIQITVLKRNFYRIKLVPIPGNFKPNISVRPIGLRFADLTENQLSKTIDYLQESFESGIFKSFTKTDEIKTGKIYALETNGVVINLITR